MRARAASLLALLVAAAFAQQAGRPVIEDRRGRFKVWGILSTGVQFETGGFSFAATGNPVRGESLDQGLEFSSRSMEGKVTQARGGPMRLRNGNLKGDVFVTLTGADGAKTNLATAALQLNAESGPMVATSPSPFTLTSAAQAEGGQRRVVASAPRGSAVFDPPESRSNDPMRSFSASGGVKVRIVNTRQGATTRDMEVVSSTAEYDRSARRLVLAGNVSIEGKEVPGDGPGFEGRMSGLDRVVVTFRENLTVDRIQAQGSPGSAEVSEGKGGG
jgi:hypothetical protein